MEIIISEFGILIFDNMNNNKWKRKWKEGINR